jgi:putative transposase
MANTYTQLYVQLVFSVKGRESLIKKAWKDNLYAYIGGIILNKNSKPLAINGMSDHIHILLDTIRPPRYPIWLKTLKRHRISI